MRMRAAARYICIMKWSLHVWVMCMRYISTSCIWRYIFSYNMLYFFLKVAICIAENNLNMSKWEQTSKFGGYFLKVLLTWRENVEVTLFYLCIFVLMFYTHTLTLIPNPNPKPNSNPGPSIASIHYGVMV